MDIGGLVLYKILSNPSESIEAWSKLKLSFFNNEYTSIYSSIVKYYNKYANLPSFQDLEVVTRDGLIKSNLKALSKLEYPTDISLDSAVEALIDEYTQTETLKKLDQFLDGITLLDSEEIKHELANILLHLEEKTHTSEKICLMSDITVLEEAEVAATQIPLGFNNKFDAEIRASTSELIMIGGMRGSGKSNVALNIYTAQYEQGNVGLYFSIEMNKREVFNRTIAMLAEVSAAKIRNGNLNDFELSKIAKVRCNMFKNAEEAYDIFLKDNDYKTFEYNLIRNYELKENNQLVIVDNSRLTLADIDMNIQKFKTQFGDKLKVVVVDYVNQIEIEDIYNWQQQVTLSKQLKKFARKYDVVMVTPYQINKEGEARFSKGLLDAADIAMVLTPGEDNIKFESAKVRHSAPFTIVSGIDWNILKIYPQEYIIHEESSNNKLKKKDPERTNEELPF